MGDSTTDLLGAKNRWPNSGPSLLPSSLFGGPTSLNQVVADASALAPAETSAQEKTHLPVDLYRPAFVAPVLMNPSMLAASAPGVFKASSQFNAFVPVAELPVVLSGYARSDRPDLRIVGSVGKPVESNRPFSWLAEELSGATTWSRVAIESILAPPGILQDFPWLKVHDATAYAIGSQELNRAVAVPVLPRDRWRVFRAGLEQLFLHVSALASNITSLRRLKGDVTVQVESESLLDRALEVLVRLIRTRRALLRHIVGLLRSLRHAWTPAGFGRYGTLLHDRHLPRTSFLS